MLRLSVLVALATGCLPVAKTNQQCDANVNQMRQLGNEPPRGDFGGRWACVFEGDPGMDGGQETLDIDQRGSHLVVTSRGPGGPAVLDGAVFGSTVVIWNNTGVTIRVDGDPRGLDGSIISGTCRARRYTCNRRRQF